MNTKLISALGSHGPSSESETVPIYQAHAFRCFKALDGAKSWIFFEIVQKPAQKLNDILRKIHSFVVHNSQDSTATVAVKDYF